MSPGSLPNQLQQKLIETPFWVAFIFGNVSRCSACKGKLLRDENKRPLPPPDDKVLGHKEFVIFSNPRSGLLAIEGEKKRLLRCCILPYFVDFNCQSIIIPENLKGKIQVKLLYREFNLASTEILHTMLPHVIILIALHVCA